MSEHKIAEIPGRAAFRRAEVPYIPGSVHARPYLKSGPMHDDPWEHGHFGAEDEAVFGSIADDGFPINPDRLRLTRVGIDIGSSTSHVIFSKLVMRRRSTEMSSEFEVVTPFITANSITLCPAIQIHPARHGHLQQRWNG